ncbi:dermonecrotic toxin domain-containing protein [Pseudomonas sp. NPDC087346]|uniref:dermonecrotic toxin domain-containing protein n=1 Tax=Pseudomonas sp. NPDC087346 TaxID=3364438 RepID=UPI00382D718D
MTDENTTSLATLSDSLLLPRQDRHYQPLLDAIPAWLVQASTQKRQALTQADPLLVASLRRASHSQHEKLRTLNASHWTAQNRTDQRLAHLQNAKTFATPLLHAEIEKRFGLNLDVEQVFLRLYLPERMPWLRLKSGAARIWTVSLLDAVLHNFESNETEDDAFDPASTYISPPSTEGRFSNLPDIHKQMPIAAFTRLCRELDIGKRYMEYLEDNLGISNPLVAAILQPDVCASEKTALVAALQMAHMQNRLDGEIHRLILGLLDGLQYLRVKRQAWHCHALTIMNAPLTGILLFAPLLESATVVSRVVAYIPDDPEHPIKEYPSAGAFAEELTLRLRDSDYQIFFSRFIDHEDRGHFFGQLNARLAPITWQPVLLGDSLPTWREKSAKRPLLQIAGMPIKGDLWAYLYRRKLDKILNDARVIAVSTATVDSKARWALWDSFTEIASTLLNIVAFVALPFVPFLGELMLAYTAYQLLDETFESIVDWTEGLPREAFEHLMGAVESVVQLGTFAAGGAIAAGEFRTLLPTGITEFIDRFVPTNLSAGKSRYWKPDLRPYELPGDLPKDARSDTLGLHTRQGKTLLALEDKLYAVSQDPQTSQYRIDHPARPDAYKPALKHNKAGAWQTALDQPLSWDRATVLRRCGPQMQRLSPALQERLLNISGCQENILRQMHVELGQVPPLLADTLQRWQIDHDIQTFIEQIGSAHAEDYLLADPATQLQLLHENGYWPADKGIQLIDRQGRTIWRNPAQDVTPVQIEISRLENGDLLKTSLQRLSESETRTLLDEKPHTPAPSPEARASTLRGIVAELAQRKRQSLFEDRYRKLQGGAGSLTQTLMDAEPGLPKELAQSILETSTDAERQQLQRGTVSSRLVDLSQQTGLQVRATRALEGLELQATQNNLDTDRLVLHSLPQLPGWSQPLRLEVRHYTHTGQLIDSIGPQDAMIRKVLVLTEQGDYQPFDDLGEQLSAPDSLFSSLLQALPDAERTALNIHIGEAEKLKQLTRDHVLSRENLLTLLAQNQNLKPAYDPAVMRLLGGTTGFRRLPVNTPTLQTHAHWLLPHLLPEELEAFVERLQRHPNGPRAELNRLIVERGRLDDILNPWIDAIPLLHPETGTRFTAEQQAIQRHRRRQMRVDILDCWKQQVSIPADGDLMIDLRLSQPILGELPQLEVDFSHVDFLTMEGVNSTRGLHGFLNCFSGLRRLALRNFRLGRLPEAINRSPHLRELILADCGVTLTPESLANLAAQTQLRTLDLYKNPLGLTPNVEKMSNLQYIDVSETAIADLPTGLLSRPHLRTALLNDNRIPSLPDALFELPSRVPEGFDLGGNPIGAADRERIKRHFGETRQDFGVLAEPADLNRVQALYTQMDQEQASELFYLLPGTLAEGRVELARLETEFNGLRDNLAIWTADLPAIHPISGEPFTIEQVLNEQGARDEFKSLLEQCWRRVSEQDDFDPESRPTHELNLSVVITGELPVLNADFSHVSHLYMRGIPGRTVGIPRFLEAFTELQSVTIHQHQLGQIPAAIFRMADLTYLSLSECHITLSRQTVLELAQLERLDNLDLSDNPLDQTPDVSQMTGLSTLLLDNTGISTLPQGLLKLEQLELVALNDNAITEIPNDILELSVDAAEKISLRNNPFSAVSVERLLAYFKKTHIDFGVQDVIDQAEMEVSTSGESDVDE